jgi:hypothetical protein
MLNGRLPETTQRVVGESETRESMTVTERALDKNNMLGNSREPPV